MGTSATKAKTKYNAKAYDNVMFRVKKGDKNRIQERADELGKSLNAYIYDLILFDLAQKENSK